MRQVIQREVWKFPSPLLYIPQDTVLGSWIVQNHILREHGWKTTALYVDRLDDSIELQALSKSVTERDEAAGIIDQDNIAISESSQSYDWDSRFEVCIGKGRFREKRENGLLITSP